MEPPRRDVASIALSEDHLALATAVRRFLAERCPPAAVRRAIDGAGAGAGTGTGEDPPFLADLAGLGWLGLHVPERHGGEGYGIAEAAIVAEELGRAVAPGPALATLWASAAASHGGGDDDLVRALATGASWGTVALGPALGARTGPDGSTLVSGATGPVLCGDEADVVIVAIRTADAGMGAEGDETWWAVPTGGATTRTLAPLDPTRSIAELTFVDLALAPDCRLPDLDRERLTALVSSLASAEAAGVAAWCVDTAATYACDRRQFGRPIGQFQAVKHRCADMLVDVEGMRSATWYAAWAASTVEPGWELAASTAKVWCADASTRVMSSGLQVHGGIGFTWEHDLHLYLKRAQYTRLAYGDAAFHRGELATGLRALIVSGTGVM